MDLDPDRNRRFSPVRISKRFCRRKDLVRKDATVTAIGRGGGGAHSYYQIKWDLDRVLRIFLLGVPRGRAEKNVGTPSPRNRFGKSDFLGGGAVPGSGAEKPPVP